MIASIKSRLYRVKKANSSIQEVENRVNKIEDALEVLSCMISRPDCADFEPRGENQWYTRDFKEKFLHLFCASRIPLVKVKLDRNSPTFEEDLKKLLTEVESQTLLGGYHFLFDKIKPDAFSTGQQFIDHLQSQAYQLEERDYSLLDTFLDLVSVLHKINFIFDRNCDPID